MKLSMHAYTNVPNRLVLDDTAGKGDGFSRGTGGNGLSGVVIEAGGFSNGGGGGARFNDGDDAKEASGLGAIGGGAFFRV
jgi:hypothetical protein